MSSDSPSSEGAPPSAPAGVQGFEAAAPRASRRGYRRVVVAVILGLSLTAAALTTVTAVRGPHVRSTVGDVASLVQRDGARLTLRTDQPLTADSIDGLSVTPEAPVEVALSGSNIELRFGALLDYGTTYRVQAPRLTGLHTGAGAPLDMTFETPSPDVFTLVRDTRTASDGTDAPDSLLRHGLASGDTRNEVVFEAPRIQEYAVTSTLAAAVVLDEADQTSVTLLDLDGDEEYPLTLPGEGAVRQLRGSGASGFFGFSFTGASGSESFSSVLFVYDTRDVSGVARPVSGLDGQPVQIIDWRFVDGTSTIVAHTFDGTFLLVDAAGARAPSPLGRHSELLGLIPGTTTVAALDPEGAAAIDLTSGDVTPIELATAPEGAGTYPGRQIVIDPAGDNLQLFSTPLTDQPGGPVESALWRVEGSDARQIYTTAVPGSRIRDFCVSPNRQYAAVETASFDALIDDYPALGGYEGMTTSIVDLDSGEVLTSLYGFLPDWCR